MPNKKSTGYDEISTETIKILSAVISPTLSLIINKCILNGVYLQFLKYLIYILHDYYFVYRILKDV